MESNLPGTAGRGQLQPDRLPTGLRRGRGAPERHLFHQERGQDTGRHHQDRQREDVVEGIGQPQAPGVDDLVEERRFTTAPRLSTR